MDKHIEIKDLQDLSDGYLLHQRVAYGQLGALLILVSPRAYSIVYGSETAKGSQFVFLPIDNVDQLVNNFDEAGAVLSYG